MAVDASAVARTTGVASKFKDLKSGSARFLPQRLLVIAQAETGVSHPTAKFQVTDGPSQVGKVAGFRAPAYCMMRELLPREGGGLGSVPVDMILVGAGAGATPASGAIAATATAVSAATTFTPIVGGYRCNRITVPKLSSVTAGDLSDIYESVRASIADTLGVPAFPAHTYGSPTAAAAAGNTGDGTLAAPTVHASNTARAGTHTLQCVTAAAGAGTFQLLDPAGFIVSSAIEADVLQTNVGGLTFTIAAGATDFAVGDSFTIEVPSSGVVVTSSWAGQSANGLTLQMEGSALSGVTWAVTQPTGGGTNPSVAAALAQVGDTWSTAVLSQFDIEDTAILDEFQLWGGNPTEETGRWAPTVKKPAWVFMGQSKLTVADATVITAARTDDNVMCVLNVPGTIDIPWKFAAEAVGKVLNRANNNPPYDYGSIALSRTTPGTDADQWSYEQRDAAVKRGCSTTMLRDGVVVLQDIVTPYAPLGEEPSSLRYIVDLVRLQNVTYNVALEFEGPKWDGKPLIPDNQPTTNPEARTPKAAKAAMNAILDGLGLAAIISDPKAAKAATVAEIDASNPKRLNIVTTFALSGNTNIKAITQNFGFFFGG